MRLIFRILTALYIAGIFVLADSPIIKDISCFNPYSLLHIPLYGLLAFFLFLSFAPSQWIGPHTLKNPWVNTSPISKGYLYMAGVMTLIVAVADEIHQSYIPNRNASILDFLLDLCGTLFTLLLLHNLFYKKEQKELQKPNGFGLHG
ncbi:MAG: VanZ family protein [Thermodesulfobacteriota bacterium]